MITSGVTDKIIPALFKAQMEFPKIERATDVTVKTKTGGSYSYSYAPLDYLLELLQPILYKNQLMINASTKLLDTASCLWSVETRLTHTSGQFIAVEVPLLLPNDMQSLGANITYARRYGLQLVLGVFAEADNDANETAKKVDSFKASAKDYPKERPIKPITVGQLNRMHAIRKERNVSDEAFKAIIVAHGFDSSANVTMNVYDAIVTAIEDAGEPLVPRPAAKAELARVAQAMPPAPMPKPALPQPKQLVSERDVDPMYQFTADDIPF